ncbi:MAG TPA: PaaI family thioesterase [Gemmatimonadaceae bacterium]|nr:PaaI family thioesterase [Gemmatimonadaceae bacterium]
MLRDNFAPWVRALNLEVRETTADSATLAMPFDAMLHRTGGIVSGQAIMALADTAMVIAFCAQFGEFRAMATVDNHTTFMRPATNTGLLAIASVLRAGRMLAYAEARVVTDTPERTLVAKTVGTYAVPPA